MKIVFAKKRRKGGGVGRVVRQVFPHFLGVLMQKSRHVGAVGPAYALIAQHTRKLGYIVCGGKAR